MAFIGTDGADVDVEGCRNHEDAKKAMMRRGCGSQFRSKPSGGRRRRINFESPINQIISIEDLAYVDFRDSPIQ